MKSTTPVPAPYVLPALGQILITLLLALFVPLEPFHLPLVLRQARRVSDVAQMQLPLLDRLRASVMPVIPLVGIHASNAPPAPTNRRPITALAHNVLRIPILPLLVLYQIILAFLVPLICSHLQDRQLVPVLPDTLLSMALALLAQRVPSNPPSIIRHAQTVPQIRGQVQAPLFALLAELTRFRLLVLLRVSAYLGTIQMATRASLALLGRSRVQLTIPRAPIVPRINGLVQVLPLVMLVALMQLVILDRHLVLVMLDTR